jgi:hypothetical protein
MKRFYSLLISCCLPVCLAAAETVIGKTDIAAVKESSRLKRADDPDRPGKQILQARSRTAVCDFAVPGDGWRKVGLRFRARVDGSGTVENNPLQEILPELSTLSVFRIETGGAGAGKPRGNYPFRGFIGSGSWDTYGHVFYLRPGENRVTLSVTPGKDVAAVWLDDIELLALPGDEITANGDFSFKTANRSCGVSGFERVGCVEKQVDGTFLINTMPNGAVSMESLPVTPGKHYILNVTWNKPDNPQLRSQINFFDADGKKLNHYVWNLNRKTAKPEGGDLLSHYEFVAPEKADSVQLYFYAGLIKRYSLKAK